MRDSRFWDTRRRSPPRGKFPNAETCKQNRYPGSSRIEPERSRSISPVRRTECGKRHYDGHADGRSRNVSQYNSNNSVSHGESPSLKFQWNNLLEGNFENPKSSMKHVSDFGSPSCGIGIRAKKGCSHGDGVPESGVVPRPTSIGTARNYRHSDGGFTSPVGKNEVGLENNSEFPRTWEQQYLATDSLRPLYNQDGDTITMPRSRSSVGYGMSISQPKAFSNASFGYLKDNSSGLYEDDNLTLPCCSSGFSRSIEMPDGYFAQDGHGQIPHSDSIEISKARLMKLPDYGRVQPSSVEFLDGYSNYTEIKRSQEGDTGVLPNDIHYRNMTRLTGDHRNQDSRRPSIVDSIVDRIEGIPSSHGDTLRKRTPWEENLSSEEHSIPKYNDLAQPSNKTEYYASVLGSKNVLPEYGTELYEHSEGWGLNAYRRDANATTYQDSRKGLPLLDHDQYFYEHEGSPNRMSTEELAMHDRDGEMFNLNRNSSTNESQIWATKLSHSQCASETFHDLNLNGETSFDKEIIHAQFDDHITSTYPTMPARRNLKYDKKIVRKSIKKRLRPAWTIPLPNSLVSSDRNVHDRLGPRVVPIANPFAGKRKNFKNSRRNSRNICETAPSSDLSDIKVRLTKTEPPEDSKEFKHLVHNAFLKFVKLLNEYPAQRRKYTDQGGIGTLKCGICGSKSKEFVDTRSLAMHAFKSSKSGCRAEHLGFHQALCVLLGWSAVAPNGSWIGQMLPVAEASALKNDLIIWPPVVLVHNSFIAYYNPDERMIVSTEELQAILLGMGFGEGKTKVSRGKPANYSTLVVTFNATFSGLQEAERLHKFYADGKHGRAEFQEIDSSGLKNSNEKTEFIPGNKERALYGYLGNAGDLDKLDFETKKHSLVKSKKEIQAIAVATLLAD